MDISFSQYYADIIRTALHLHTTFKENGVTPGTPVAFWVSGYQYVDAVHMMAISRTGHPPLLCSAHIDNTSLVHSLMQAVGSEAIVYDYEYFGKYMKEWNHAQCSIPIRGLSTTAQTHIPTVDEESELPIWNPKMDDIAFIVHTSGSVNGTPRPLARMFKSIVESVTFTPSSLVTAQTTKQEMKFSAFSMQHGVGLMTTIRAMRDSVCLLLMGGLDVSAELLHALPKQDHESTSIILPSPKMAYILSLAQKDESLFDLLKGLNRLHTGGSELRPDLCQWAYDKCLPLVSLFGASECGALLASRPMMRCDILFPLPHTNLQFLPIPEFESDESAANNTKIMELVVPESSPRCPSHNIRGFSGEFYTGDVFELVNGANADGGVIWRGRKESDFFKDQTTKKIDAKSIESDVYQFCSDLVSICVIAGNGRPSPVLFLEPSASHQEPSDWENLKSEVVRRLKPSTMKRYTHERITDVKCVVVVASGKLPRTHKGNIKQRAVDQEYKELLDVIFGK